MPYRKITQPKLADSIVAELEQMILEGSLQPGQKLPPERELAIQFQVSRPSLREAIQRLEARGLLYRRQGGGTYVQNALSKGIADPLFELLSTHPEAQYDLLEFRHALEGICAYYAALRGTGSDFERIRQVQTTIEEAGQLGSLVAESAAVFRAPVADLINPANRGVTVLQRDGHEWRGPAFLVYQDGNEHLVWGFTAMLLDSLFRQLGWAEEWDTSRVLPFPRHP